MAGLTIFALQYIDALYCHLLITSLMSLNDLAYDRCDTKWRNWKEVKRFIHHYSALPFTWVLDNLSISSIFLPVTWLETQQNAEDERNIRESRVKARQRGFTWATCTQCPLLWKR
jgi:hypothetical protein